MRSLFLLILLLPTVASAATYDLLAPIGSMSTGLSLATYLQGIFQFLIGMAGVLAVVMIVWCGIKMMGTGSVAAKSEAKQCITNAILGLLLAAGSWIILNTINANLTLSDLTLGNTPTLPVAGPPPPATNDPMPTLPGWYFRYTNSAGLIKNSPVHGTSDQCLTVMKKEKDNGVVISMTGGVECFEIKPAATPPPAAGETATRNALCGNTSCVGSTPIGINKAPCSPTRNSKNCTNVEGLSGAAVTAIKNLQAACGCNVVITGGTEGGHSTAAAPTAIHLPGNGVFDLRWDGDSSALASAIKSGGQRKASFSGNYRWLYNGFWYTDEVSAAGKGGVRHWHVCPNGASASYCSP